MFNVKLINRRSFQTLEFFLFLFFYQYVTKAHPIFPPAILLKYCRPAAKDHFGN